MRTAALAPLLALAFAAADPDRVFYSLSDFLAASLTALCPAR